MKPKHALCENAVSLGLNACMALTDCQTGEKSIRYKWTLTLEPMDGVQAESDRPLDSEKADDSTEERSESSAASSTMHTGQPGLGPFTRPRALSGPSRFKRSTGQQRCRAWVDELCALLSLYLLPSSALAGVGWLLTQLAPAPATGVAHYGSVLFISRSS